MLKLALCSICVFIFFLLFSFQIFFFIILPPLVAKHAIYIYHAIPENHLFQWCEDSKPGFAPQWAKKKLNTLFRFYYLICLSLIGSLSFIFFLFSFFLLANEFVRKQPTCQKTFWHIYWRRFIIVNKYNLSFDYFCYVWRITF